MFYKRSTIIRITVYVLMSWGFTVLIIPLVILFCIKQGWYDTINSRKVHAGNVPRLGSIGFVPVFLVASSLYLNNLQTGLFRAYLPLVVAGSLIFILGIIDDFYELSPRLKLICQGIVSLIPVIFGFQITQCGPLQFGMFSPVISFCWFIGIINAFNLIDGIDALCGSLSLCIAVTSGLVFHFLGGSTVEYQALGFILAGSVAGFLIYNKPKAKIFMGDGGSQFLGFIIAAIPLFKTAPDLEFNRFPLSIVLTSMPILDTIAAVWRRTREGRSFFSSDKSHLHHKLMDMGFSVAEILGVLVSIQVGLCVISLWAVIWIKGFHGFLILCGACAAMVVFFVVIHYTHRTLMQTKKE